MWPWVLVLGLMALAALVWLVLLIREVVRKSLRLLRDLERAGARVSAVGERVSAELAAARVEAARSQAELLAPFARSGPPTAQPERVR